MSDLDERFLALGRVGPPDLWPDVQHREPRPMREPPPGRRFLAAAVAFVVASAGIALGVRAFRGAESAPAAAVGNGKIAFVGDDETGIYVVNPDGTGRAKLTDGFGPAWSPDGNRIAFLRGISEGNLQLYVMNADGTALTLIVADWRGNNLSWSPDGTRFAYYCACDGAIHVMNVDGTDDYRLTESNAARDPAWSPDGTKIAFRQPVNGDFEIFVINVDGSVLTRLTNDPAHDLGPAWSPDGTRIAFSRSSERPGGIHEDIYVMNADGSEVARLTEDPAWDSSPVWSPDGTKIAFASSREGGTWQIYVMNADGSEQSQLTYLPDGAMAPDWQPVPVSETPAPSPIETTAPASARIDMKLDVGLAVSVTYGAGSIWAAAEAEEDHRIVRIDPDTGEILASIPVVTGPTRDWGGGALSVGAGGVWVAGVVDAPGGPDAPGGGSDAALLRIDPTTNEVVATINLGGIFAVDAAADDTGVWAYVAEGVGEAARVVRVDPATNEVVARIAMPTDFHLARVVTGEEGVWVSGFPGGAIPAIPGGAVDPSLASGWILRIDPLTNEIFATFSWADGDAPLAVGGGAVWAANGGDDGSSLARIDPATNEVTVELSGAGWTTVLAYGEGGLWFRPYSAEGRWTVARFNPIVGAVDASVELATPIAIAVAPGSVWVVTTDPDASIVRITLD